MKTANSSFDPNDQGIDLLTTKVNPTVASGSSINYYWWNNHYHYPYGWYGGGACPTCGHCPTCGRGGHGHQAYPYYPSYPNYPYYPAYVNIHWNVNAAAGVGNQIFNYRVSY